MPIIYVPGNIDYYSRKPMEQLLQEAAELVEKIGNIHLLSNSAVTIGGTKFLGTTLWTRIDDAHATTAPRYSNDFKQISTVEGRWNVAKQNLEHELATDFLESELSASDHTTTVVITHNIPHISVNDPKFSDPRYRDQSMNAIFVADMKWLTEAPFAPDFWIAGTNIITADVTLGRTNVLSNGRGHPTKKGNEIVAENLDFDFDCTFEISPKPRIVTGPRM